MARSVMDCAQGLATILDLAWDRVLCLAALAVALGAGSWMGTVLN